MSTKIKSDAASEIVALIERYKSTTGAQRAAASRRLRALGFDVPRANTAKLASMSEHAQHASDVNDLADRMGVEINPAFLARLTTLIKSGDAPAHLRPVTERASKFSLDAIQSAINEHGATCQNDLIDALDIPAKSVPPFRARVQHYVNGGDLPDTFATPSRVSAKAKTADLAAALTDEERAALAAALSA